MTRCSDASRDACEPLAGSAPRADVWVVVEHPGGWGDAPLARAEHGVRVLMARGPRPQPGARADMAPGVRAWVAHHGPDPQLRVGRLADPAEVAAWDLAALAAGSHRTWGQPDPHPLLLVCANGRRDRCCGHAGGRLAERLWAGPRADRVLTCTHLGGHRFAPTALMLPTGALHGRLDPAAAAGLLEAAAAGRMPAEHLRGFASLSEPAQVADAHARRVAGVTTDRPLPVRLLPTAEDDRLRAMVTLPPGGPARGAATDAAGSAPLEVLLRRTSAAVLASCGRPAEELARWVVDAGRPDAPPATRP